MNWKRKIALIPIITIACIFGLWLVFGGTGLPKTVERPVSHDRLLDFIQCHGAGQEEQG